jgi:hypothetical protein
VTRNPLPTRPKLLPDWRRLAALARLARLYLIQSTEAPLGDTLWDCLSLSYERLAKLNWFPPFVLSPPRPRLTERAGTEPDNDAFLYQGVGVARTFVPPSTALMPYLGKPGHGERGRASSGFRWQATR